MFENFKTGFKGDFRSSLLSITEIGIVIHEVMIWNIYFGSNTSDLGREKGLNFVLILSKFTIAVLKINPLDKTTR